MRTTFSCCGLTLLQIFLPPRFPLLSLPAYPTVCLSFGRSVCMRICMHVCMEYHSGCMEYLTKILSFRWISHSSMTWQSLIDAPNRAGAYAGLGYFPNTSISSFRSSYLVLSHATARSSFLRPDEDFHHKHPITVTFSLWSILERTTLALLPYGALL